MLGTLSGALEVRGIPLAGDDITAEVHGINEMRERIPVLTEIIIRYRLRIPAGSREKVDRALAGHQARCPTAHSLREAVAIRWEAEVAEA